MDRARLVRLLDSEDEAIVACRRAVADGAPFWISPTCQPASGLAATYTRRERLNRRVGVPQMGFSQAVDSLRGMADQPTHVAAVDSQNPPYHFQLFLNQDLTAVMACLGVDRRLGYWLRPGDPVLLACEVVELESEDFPGWIRIRFRDTAGRVWYVVDKMPVFGVEATGASGLPVSADIRCRVVDIVADPDPDRDGPPCLVVSTDVDGVTAEDGTDQFIVRDEALRRPNVGGDDLDLRIAGHPDS